MLFSFLAETLCLVQTRKEGAFDRISFVSVPSGPRKRGTFDPIGLTAMLLGPRCYLYSGRKLCASFKQKKSPLDRPN